MPPLYSLVVERMAVLCDSLFPVDGGFEGSAAEDKTIVVGIECVPEAQDGGQESIFVGETEGGTLSLVVRRVFYQQSSQMNIKVTLRIVGKVPLR